MTNLFFLYAKNLCKELSEREFSLFPERNAKLDISTGAISFAKNDIGNIFYFVVIINIDAMGIENYDKLRDYYRSFCEENFEQLGFSNYVILNLLVTNNSEFSIETENHAAGQLVYDINWIVDINQKKLRIPKGQPSNLIGLNSVIKNTLADFDETSNVVQLFGASDQLVDVSKMEREAEKNEAVAKTKPIITAAIGSVNILIFLIITSLGGPTVENLISFGALTPTAGQSVDQYYRIVNCMFLHGGISHLLFNCIMLYVFGSRVEKYFGHLFFALIYASSGIVASIATILFFPSISVGASGAIMGLCGAAVVHSRLIQKSLDGYNFYMLLVFSIGLLVSSSLFPNVNNVAHIAGLLTGALFAFFIRKLLVKRNGNV